MHNVGRIVRLQIQRSSLKTGEKPNRTYDPAPLLAVDRLALGPDGALGAGSDGSWVAEPCRPFTGWALGGIVESRVLKESLQFLEGGTRGYYCQGVGSGIVSIGDRVAVLDA